MDLKVKIYQKRAENELQLSNALVKLSEEDTIKLDLEINKEETYYSSSVSHAYYAIFYSAKALLLTKQIDTKSPEVHKKTFEAFEKEFVNTGIVDLHLLNIYKKIVIRADELLEVFKEEKWKRGHYTYQTIPQANKEPAEESVKNAKLFITNINRIIEKIRTDEENKKNL